MRPALAALAAAAVSASAASPPGPAYGLRTEYVVDPIVLDVPVPRLYWKVAHADRGQAQTAYRVVVTSLTGGNATVWDSGVVASNATTHVEYAGAALTSDTVYSWTVAWTDAAGATAPWAPWASFGTGLLTQPEWAPASWIGCPAPGAGKPNYNQLRMEFSLGAAAGVTVTQARLYITGMGYYSARVNGEWARQWAAQGRDRPRLDPGWSTYEMRALYNAYDLTQMLSPSAPNALALTMGNGWPDVDPVPGNTSYAGAQGEAVDVRADPRGKLAALVGELAPWSRIGAPRKVRALLIVRTSDGKVQTFATSAAGWGGAAAAAPPTAGAAGWQCGSGALLDDSVYDGCVWDARLYTTGWDAPGFTYATGNWTAAVLASDPGGAHPTRMSAQTMPAVTVVSELSPRTFESPAPGVYVFDFGQNFAGVVRLTLPGPVPAGVTVTMRHAELLQHTIYGPKDGSIYVGNLRSALATDVYTTAGTTGTANEVFEPVFTYHGFRYVEVTGLPAGVTPDLSLVTGLVTRTANDQVGSVTFPYSADVINQLQRAVSWGLGSNMMSLPSDCPQRDEVSRRGGRKATRVASSHTRCLPWGVRVHAGAVAVQVAIVLPVVARDAILPIPNHHLPPPPPPPSPSFVLL